MLHLRAHSFKAFEMVYAKRLGAVCAASRSQEYDQHKEHRRPKPLKPVTDVFISLTRTFGPAQMLENS